VSAAADDAANFFDIHLLQYAKLCIQAAYLMWHITSSFCVCVNSCNNCVSASCCYGVVHCVVFVTAEHAAQLVIFCSLVSSFISL